MNLNDKNSTLSVSAIVGTTNVGIEDNRKMIWVSNLVCQNGGIVIYLFLIHKIVVSFFFTLS